MCLFQYIKTRLDVVLVNIMYAGIIIKATVVRLVVRTSQPTKHHDMPSHGHSRYFIAYTALLHDQRRQWQKREEKNKFFLMHSTPRTIRPSVRLLSPRDYTLFLPLFCRFRLTIYHRYLFFFSSEISSFKNRCW